MRTKRHTKNRSKHHISLVKSARKRRLNKRRGNTKKLTQKRARAKLRRLGLGAARRR